MSKKQVKKEYPLVLIKSIDHSLETDGARSPILYFMTVGWLIEETKHGYHVAHWVFDEDADNNNNVTTFIAKTKGHKIKRLK